MGNILMAWYQAALADHENNHQPVAAGPAGAPWADPYGVGGAMRGGERGRRGWRRGGTGWTIGR